MNGNSLLTDFLNEESELDLYLDERAQEEAERVTGDRTWRGRRLPYSSSECLEHRRALERRIGMRPKEDE